MKVGDYVRTDKGIIGKIKAIDNQTELEDLYLVKRRWYYKENIIKSSPNIIDLIEVGDYVDGLKVVDIVEHLHGHKDIVMTNGKFQWSTSNDDYDIKSIVTKEQFEAIKYEVN